MRTQHNHLREPWRAAEQIAEQFAHIVVGAQDRHQLDRRRHARQRGVERRKRGVGIARARERLQQRGDQLGQHFPRARALHGLPAAEVPAADHLRRLFGVVEAETAQRLQGVGVVDDAGEDEIAAGVVELRRRLEQPRVVFFDPSQSQRERVDEGVERVEGEEVCETLERLRFDGQPLRLLVGDHLQAMFDAAQEHVGFGKLILRFARHPALGTQFAEHVERARTAQSWPATAEDQLLGLHEELDFADAAATEFHVVAGHGDDLVAAHGMDLPLHRVDIGDRGVVEIFAPDEGGELVEQRFRRARDRRRSAAP